MTEDDRKQRRYQITLTAPATMTAEESTRRLRAFLKMAWRAFGLRCTSATEITTQAQPQARPQDPQATTINHDKQSHIRTATTPQGPK